MSRKLFERLYQCDIRLITRMRKNMKNRLMEMTCKLLLRKGAIRILR
ncbi:MAG: transposase [Treponema sp.]|nr:transposase [Treponema sp.]